MPDTEIHTVSAEPISSEDALSSSASSENDSFVAVLDSVPLGQAPIAADRDARSRPPHKHSAGEGTVLTPGFSIPLVSLAQDCAPEVVTVGAWAGISVAELLDETDSMRDQSKK